jgi:NifU-like protein involved in Fe-S cluster formation
MEREDPLHREILEEHARSPLFQGELEKFSHIGNCQSKKTGNSCKIELLSSESTIKKIRFSGQGSALSQACASLMCSQLNGMDIIESKHLCRNILEYVELRKEFTLPGDLIVYHTIIRFPDRHDCSLLAWRALRNGLES